MVLSRLGAYVIGRQYGMNGSPQIPFRHQVLSQEELRFLHEAVSILERDSRLAGGVTNRFLLNLKLKLFEVSRT